MTSRHQTWEYRVSHHVSARNIEETSNLLYVQQLSLAAWTIAKRVGCQLEVSVGGFQCFQLFEDNTKRKSPNGQFTRFVRIFRQNLIAQMANLEFAKQRIQ